ncbi:MAG: hypothetical protein U9R48_10945 [Chloroflexota bacterium]|nr:hypothetical protein [Chloroflexota bacterium]
MNKDQTTRGVTTAQIVGVVVFTLALFFVVAFTTKVVEAYRLRNWRDQLEREITQMERQKEALQAEIRRRQSEAWVDKVLRDAGWVPDGAERVVVMQVTPASSPPLTPAPGKHVLSAPSVAGELPLFHNPHWRAWQRLIFGFDEHEDIYYNNER